MDSQLLCYNCRKPGHFKGNCPHPIVSKHQDNNTTTSPSKETGERYKRSDKPESSNSRNEGRRKAMVVNETSDTIATESSSSSSSSEDENTDEEKGLLCLFSQVSDELCLMADEDEVNSHSLSCYSAESNMSTGSERTITEALEGKSEILNDPLVTEQEFNQFLEHSQHIQSLLRDTTTNESRESFHSIGNPIGYVKEDSVLERNGSLNSSSSSTSTKMASPLKSTASSKKKKA
ncbi:PREDICTED: uncharacterized protein LOC109163912 [Ipomoea nil]|uniref:uncharacterized protein LOC109163912 n=1 Tax=Ipomoea nil TaxID=35883 RepID=UPI000900BAB6|nr:PREDICTED: uncharacterized protein LOC109163912 [Ipomoea nil]